ncbi:putative oxidoreductase protein [Neofusicoccum parvum UCRNP2]|uniref:Iron ascorbate family oxidoreductase n=2 Tax=Neofusicoccum parvum TaxID=310453 RepID=A0ACB5S7F4_9PEZI|nr:putative oxidoreductase protein [Neofusicoccum parvum UCRNP2]GME28730.1 iron ascorbate family oxidoreductase [Neofusicoccum parvum]
MAAVIPVVDVSCPTPAVAAHLLRAASAHGFVFVSNYGAILPPHHVCQMFELSRAFFQSPREVKAECPYQKGKNQGWVGMHAETLDPKSQKRGDFKEAFNIGEYTGECAPQPLPAPLRPYDAQLGLFQARCHALCAHILDIFGLALEIPASEGGASWFAQRHDRSAGPSGSILRLLYYPALPPVDSTDIRAGAHSDYGSITLLFQQPRGQPGLEILTHEGKWAPVPVNPTGDEAAPPILVNIGDLLSYWTDGLLKSTVHRVVFPKEAGGGVGEDRYSMAYFCHPLDDAKLVPVPSQVTLPNEDCRM